jgi:dihydrofolate synthase/folylpolyglutamate synthase
MLEGMGKRTGLTVSPHIISVTERVQVDGEPLPDEKFLAYLNEFLAGAGKWSDLEPTYFELLIAFAYWVFAKEKVDYAVVEVGLGGLLDATNVVGRADKVCVITPIGLDHTNVLGDTIAAIATQKAGIIQPGNPVFSAEQDPAARRVIEQRAGEQGAMLHVAREPTSLPPLPYYQRANFGLAAAAASYVARRDGLPALSNVDITTVAQAVPPGRFERFRVQGKTIILDGAHNPQKLTALFETLSPRQVSHAAWLVSFVKAPDQKLEDCLSVLHSYGVERCTVTEFVTGQDLKARRSFPATEVARQAARLHIEARAVPQLQEALDDVLKEPASTVVVTGSLFLVALLRPYVLRLAAAEPAAPAAAAGRLGSEPLD